MTPKEKADQLVNKFENLQPTKLSDYSKIYTPTAKQCALIVVDEIIEEVFMWSGGENSDWDVKRMEYLTEVKREIENI